LFGDLVYLQTKTLKLFKREGDQIISIEIYIQPCLGSWLSWEEKWCFISAINAFCM